MFSYILYFLLFLGSTIALDCYSVDGRNYCRCPSGEVEDLDHDGVVSCENNAPNSVTDSPIASNNLGYTGDDGYIFAILILVFIIFVLSFLLLRRYRLVDCTLCINPFQRSFDISLQMRNPATDPVSIIELDTYAVHVSDFSNEIVVDELVNTGIHADSDSVSDYHSVDEFN